MIEGPVYHSPCPSLVLSLLQGHSLAVSRASRCVRRGRSKSERDQREAPSDGEHRHLGAERCEDYEEYASPLLALLFNHAPVADADPFPPTPHISSRDSPSPAIHKPAMGFPSPSVCKRRVHVASPTSGWSYHRTKLKKLLDLFWSWSGNDNLFVGTAWTREN